MVMICNVYGIKEYFPEKVLARKTLRRINDGFYFYITFLFNETVLKNKVGVISSTSWFLFLSE